MQTKAVVDHIVGWLEDYRMAAGSDGFVVGVSGGVDSAVTSVLCARTGSATILLDMPIHQSSLQRNRGLAHIRQVEAQFSNVTSASVDLTHTFDVLVEALKASGDDATHQLALANTRSRLRMTTLYYFAGSRGLLVAGTGNKVEDFGVGFFTKYGDGGVDLSPIADLMKSEVYTLGRELGVSDEILNAPPTDGLWGDDRSDEDQLGATYPELEWAMGFSGDESKLSVRQGEVLEIYRRHHAANTHKMKSIPVCLIPASLRPL
ncbi:MAG: NAD(+) synthase [Cryomorphaceae bacterium]|nr:MAG: NAD(+) synthase [Cryomorphaceae bacterium]